MKVDCVRHGPHASDARRRVLPPVDGGARLGLAESAQQCAASRDYKHYRKYFDPVEY